MRVSLEDFRYNIMRSSLALLLLSIAPVRSWVSMAQSTFGASIEGIQAQTHGNCKFFLPLECDFFSLPYPWQALLNLSDLLI